MAHVQEEFKDIIGNTFRMGDRVATDVSKKNSSALRVGVVTGVREEKYGTFVKITYEVASRYRYKQPQKMLRRGIWRTPDGVVKVA